MRVALVAGDEAGHAFPAFALAQQFTDAGHDATVYTGVRWSDVELGRASIAELAGLAAAVGDDDSDAGAKLSTRAARMAVRLAPDLRGSYDVVISDVINGRGARRDRGYRSRIRLSGARAAARRSGFGR